MKFEFRGNTISNHYCPVKLLTETTKASAVLNFIKVYNIPYSLLCIPLFLDKKWSIKLRKNG